jgi:protoheme IX farnesyltransferase
MTSAQENLGLKIGEKVKALFELLKFRLAFLIAFSGAMGYSLGASSVSWSKMVLFCIASIGITGAANIINQIIEIDLDKMMKRTQNRPLPSGRVTTEQAIVWAIF